MKRLNTHRILITASVCFIVLSLGSCTTNDPDSSGHAYTDDMYTSPAMEADDPALNENAGVPANTVKVDPDSLGAND
jgi:hypothetical protein